MTSPPAIPEVGTAGCATAQYVDRGPALPMGVKGTCGWCSGVCLNRGCDSCKRNFHRSCFKLHQEAAASASGGGGEWAAGVLEPTEGHEVRERCATGCYVDRGPAIPLGDKAKCAWCGGTCWNRGCSECPSNFHKTCYYAHLSRARLLRSNGDAVRRPSDEKLLNPFLTVIGMQEYYEPLRRAGVRCPRDLIKVDDGFLAEKVGISKVVHRRKLMRQVAQAEAIALGAEGLQDEEPAVFLEVVVTRPALDTRLGIVLSETPDRHGVEVQEVCTGSVSSQCGLEPGMVILRIDDAPVAKREEFVSAVEGKKRFVASVRPPVPLSTPFEQLHQVPQQQDFRDSLERLRILGTGSSSVVYLVRDEKTRKLYALKSVEKRSRAAPEARDLILRERDMMKHAQWSGVGLIRLYHTFQSPSHLYFLLEYCAGGSLDSYLSHMPGGKASEEVCRHYGAQIFSALRSLHRLGVVYRDLKPGNVLLDEKGAAKLADFGLSRPLAWGDRARTFVGSPLFMAPEMILGQPYSYAVDWWSYGILLYILLTGQHPFSPSFDEAQPEAVWGTVLSEPPAPPPSSIEAAALVSGLLEKNPDLRLEGDVIKKQPWFRGVDWAAIESGAVSGPPGWAPPPGVITQDDANSIKRLSFRDSLNCAPLSSEQQALFLGFTYSNMIDSPGGG